MKKIFKKLDDLWTLLTINWPFFIMAASVILLIIFIIYVAATGGFY